MINKNQLSSNPPAALHMIRLCLKQKTDGLQKQGHPFYYH